MSEKRDPFSDDARGIPSAFLENTQARNASNKFCESADVTSLEMPVTVAVMPLRLVDNMLMSRAEFDAEFSRENGRGYEIF
jgi:hypothetical protein